LSALPLWPLRQRAPALFALCVRRVKQLSKSLT